MRCDPARATETLEGVSFFAPGLTPTFHAAARHFALARRNRRSEPGMADFRGARRRTSGLKFRFNAGPSRQRSTAP
jgi:hypothetical protein